MQSLVNSEEGNGEGYSTDSEDHNWIIIIRLLWLHSVTIRSLEEMVATVDTLQL